MGFVFNSYNVTLSYLQITDNFNNLSLSDTQIEEYLEADNNNDVDVSKTIARYICFHMSMLALADTGKYYIFIHRK